MPTIFIIMAMIALMMEAVSTSEMSVNFYATTRPYIPEGSQSSSTDTDACISCNVKQKS
jgi:hypothetical protein